ncbi:MAG: GatB/YqeY domain-containing protein [Actinobacteria bacterium]|nr:GatB/YqeY domain-containing protein [Actinomycetota bacterium]
MHYQTLLDEIKNAMKQHDQDRVSILRQVHNEVKYIEVNERREISEADVDAMLKRVLKQTGETLEGSIKAANDDARTEKLTGQVAILESYIPKQVAGEELEALIDATIASEGATSKRDMGKVMAALNAATGGNYDKAAAAKFVGMRLS